MLSTARIDDEDNRLAALTQFHVLDSPPEREFDDLTQLAAQICTAPIALISLVDDQRQWFKSRFGLEVSQTPRADSFCAHALHVGDLFIVPDATQDLRFAHNPLVTGEPHIRFYAGAPLRTADGHTLGTLCVIDHVPRALTPEQAESLRILSRQVMSLLELRRTARSLKVRTQLLQAVAQESTDAIFVKDRAGRYLLFNEAASAFVSREVEDVLGKDDRDLFDPESAALIRARDRRVMESGQAETDEETITSAGIERTFLAMKAPYRDDEGRIIGTIGISRDISDRKRMETLAGEHRCLLELISSGTPIEQSMRKLLQMIEAHCDEMLCSLLLLQEDGVHLRNAAGPRIPAAYRDAVEGLSIGSDVGSFGAAAQRREPVITQDIATDPLWENLREVALASGLRACWCAPVFDRDRHVLAVFAVYYRQARLPTQEHLALIELALRTAEIAIARHRGEAALQRAYDELRKSQEIMLQQERLRAFGQLASGVAHDINNAICPVAIYTKVLLKTDASLSPQAREYIEIIQQAGKAVGDTVSRLRRFYQEQADPACFAPVHLATIIEEVAALTRPHWSDMAQERGAVVDLRVESQRGLPAISGVESEIREALINLIFNAVDAMPEGGTLTLRARAVSAGPNVLPRVCVEVSDTGIGMDAEARRRCLEPFYTTKGERGTGLGLSIVAGIVQRHEAEIAIESAPGAGTTIRIVFPPPEEQSAPVPAPVRSGGVPPMKILVVDDDSMILRAMRVALESEGHRAHCVLGGQAAISAFRDALDGGEPFDAVFTDLGMGHVDGRKVATAVKAAAPKVPVILLTGWGHQMEADPDMPPGVDHLLPKPVSPEELSEALAVCRRALAS